MLNQVKSVAYRILAIGSRKSVHLTRFGMYEAIKGIGLEFPSGSSVCSISHSSNLLDYVQANEAAVTEANYPEFNVLDLPFNDDAYDLVLADQVLEHVEGNPADAINQCMRILKSGGVGIITTCLINPIHKHPGDYWRFTPDGLANLIEGEAEIIECSGWGNLRAVNLLHSPLRRQLVPMRTWHPLYRIATQNDPEWPIVTWIVFRKR